MYAHRFDPVKLGKLVNSAPELFARTKAEVLAVVASVLEPWLVILQSRFSLPVSCVSFAACVYCECNT